MAFIINVINKFIDYNKILLRYKNKVIKVYKKYTSITIINRCIIKAGGKLIK